MIDVYLALTPSICSIVEERMSNDEVTIQETTQPTISGHRVGVGNIWERDLPDATGAVAPRVSAGLWILDIASDQERYQEVFAGSVLLLGADRYCVVKVEQGVSALGAITLRKIEP
jgi:hypothetical protein